MKIFYLFLYAIHGVFTTIVGFIAFLALIPFGIIHAIWYRVSGAKTIEDAKPYWEKEKNRFKGYDDK